MSITLDSAAFLEGFAASRAFFEAEAAARDRAIAEEIVDRAKATVAVLTGQTRDSIKIQGEGVGPTGPYVDVGVSSADDDHADYLEFGTEHSAAQPFMRPAIAAAGG